MNKRYVAHGNPKVIDVKMIVQWLGKVAFVGGARCVCAESKHNTRWLLISGEEFE